MTAASYWRDYKRKQRARLEYRECENKRRRERYHKIEKPLREAKRKIYETLVAIVRLRKMIKTIEGNPAKTIHRTAAILRACNRLLECDLIAPEEARIVQAFKERIIEIRVEALRENFREAQP